MIVFDLRCPQSHVFEAWFGSSAAYEDQRARGLLACPVCGDAEIVKAAMAPNVGAKGNTRTEIIAKPQSTTPPSPAALKAALHALATAQAQALAKSQWVGRAFADTARAMHDGEVAAAPIHGETTLAEAKALIEEGVPVAALPLPIVPPDAVN
ncbi:DUF1178 family protein [Sphingomonas psychrolutea]|uniref:DUF1178 family protein n=1 Tax=Sphingomonas psychrolutea TaxID=1259676 RepID=A0ABQ1G8I4_9SPHN|nr:DUF1178 family protein [Sphingomonas psychrolutea]GGA38772.1 hypothetical protein GCM10011395_06360 [Sphingomonas psychrolutea]